MPENKRYLIEVPGLETGSGIWDADKWERNKEAFMADYPDANVFELGDYDPDDTNENDQFMLTFEDDPDSSGVWDAAKWERNKEAFTADNPEAKVSRVRYVDYWGERATANRERRKALEQPDAERNARLAEIGYYDDLSYGQGEFNMDTDLGYGLKPLSSAIETNSVSGEATYLDPRVQEFFVNDTAETERQAEIARLDAEYESNPSVIRQREIEAQIAKEREEYIDKSLAEIRADIETEVDAIEAGKGAFYKTASAQGMGDAAMIQQAIDFMKGKDAGQAMVQNERMETYNSAIKLFEKARQAREVAGKGFWAAQSDVAKDKLRDLVTQSDIEMYNQIGGILTRLEDKLGSLDDVGEDVLEANLSKEEQALIKAFFEYNSAMADAQQDMSGAYMGGKIFGESVGFMLEFLATGGLAGGTGKAASSGVGRALVKWASKAAKGTAKRAFRTGTTKALRGLSSAAVGTLARTVAAPGTYRNMAEQSVKIEDGHLDRTKNAMKGFFDSYIENLSEISGGVIGKSLGMFGLNPSKLLGKVSFGKIGQLLADNRLAQGLSKGVKALFGKQGALTKLGFTGIFEEVEEEYIGNFIREVTGVQPGALAEMHKDGNFGAMLIGFAPMTLFGAGMSAANMAATNIEAANLGKKLRETLGQHYTEDAVSHMMSLVDNAENADEVWKAIEPMAGALNEEETTMLYQYGAFKAQNKAMLFARKAQERQLADAKRAEIQQDYGRFWQEGEDGAQSVQMADLNDGRRVFVLSAANEQGEIAVVDTRTGDTGIANVADIKSAEQDGVTSPQTRTWSMDAFLDYTIALDRRSAEQTRMVNERDQQIEALKSGITEGMEINLGTEGSPVIMLATGQFTKDGVLAGDASGNIHTIGWEQVADALGTPIRVKTDQDLIDEETAAIAARRAERRKKAGSSSQQLRAALDETAQQTAEVVSLEERHIPKNPDGSVNETAFWEQDPEGYAQWNDEQNNDGGADTMRQLAVSKMLLAGVLAEAQKATQTSNPAERKAAEQAVREIQDKIDRYTVIEQSYVERAIAPLRERAMKWNSLTGASVILVENEEQLAEISGEAARQSAGGARVRGFAKDGRAYIYLPGVQDAAEIDAVFVHEAVSHQGLKGLLGQKGFDELCEQVWQMMSPEMQNVFINYPGVNGNRLAAADEYIAHIAERIGTGVADETERTIWEKIVDFVRNILRAMGIEVGMNERELSDLLHMAYADLARNLSEAEKIAQQNAERKEAVGAAPATARQMYDEYIKEGLTPEEVSQGVQNDFNAAKDAYDAKVAEKPTIKAGESTASFIERKKAYNEELGRLEQELKMQQALMDEIAKIQNTAMEAAVEEAPVAEEVLEDNGIGVDGENVDDVRFSVITPQMDADYLAAVERGDMETAQRMVIEAARLAMPNTAMIDRNGYPKIFYHNTDAEFTAFGAEYNGTATDAGWLGDGFYFYGDPGEGDLYGRNKMQVFLNIEEPYYATSEENNFLAEANSRKESIAFSERLKEEWYDGVYYNGDLRQEAVAFYPSQIKSADPVTYDDAGNVIPLSERFNPENEDIRFSTVRIDPNANQQAEGNVMFSTRRGSLVGMHNISEDKLRKVIKQGGSANPSAAVIDIERQSFDSYGEISFIMPSSLVDARTGRNAGTFTADAWTPTYPQVSRRFSDDELQRKYWRDISAIPEEMSHEVRMAFDSWLDNRNASGLAYMFLHERGEAPEMVRIEAKFPQEIKDKVSAILGEGRTGLYDLSAEEKQAMLELYIQEEFGGNREEFDKSIADRIQRIEDRLSTGKVPSFIEKRITLDLQWMKEYGYDYDALSKFVSAITADIRHAGEVNVAATTNRALDYIKDNGLEKEFDRWKESLNDRYGIKEYLFDGYTPSGNPRWLPNTMENASRLMNKQGLAGGTGMAVSFNRFVATLAPKKKTLSDIRASKDLLVEDEKLEDDFREKWSEVFFDLGVKCQPDAKGYEDYGLERLTEAAQKKNPGAYLKKEYGVELSQEDLQKLDEMIKAIKTEFPARYFEIKFQRPVYLNEFAAAVMPTTASEDVKQAVSEAGLPIFEYDSAVEGSRHEATLKATDMDSIRFSIANENQAIFVSNAARAVEAIKMEKATPEQWLAMIEKNGGLKAGEDKWMGLSDWLKASKAKTLTKKEVLDFINENMIVIEEQHYAENAEADAENTYAMIERLLQEKFGNYIAEYYEQNNGEDDNLYGGDSYEYAMDKLREEMNDEFPYTIERSNSVVYLTFPYEETDELQEWADKLGVKFAPQNPINNTRLAYTTDGLNNRHEIALIIPTIEPWNESDEVHFGDAGEGRAVAWIRFGETWEQRPSPQISRKVLVIDEIQSKRHQEGREKGYKKSNDEIYKALEAFQSFNRSMRLKYGPNSEVVDWSEEDKAEFNRLRDAHSEASKGIYRGVPDAPFDKNWHELAMKRMLRYAAEEGYDVIAWTKGEQQAERYNLSHLVKRIRVSKPTEDGSRIVDIHYRDEYDDFKNLVVDADGKIVHGEYAGNTLADVVGKEMALQIMNSEEATEFKGEGLKVGGEGMKGFYDKMLPAFMNKYGKKWGIKVEDIELPNVEEAGRVMHSVPVTEEMKASVMEGQVMFSVRNTPISPEVRAEMDVIAATAIVNGNYMLAPNGQPTKLTADQWAMVRTKNFINWFGDWINDPENASKVVDENGEPMVVYHGSNWRPALEEPGLAKFRMRSGLMGRGAYFTDNFTNAADYAREKYEWEHYKEVDEDFVYDNGYITEAFLNIRNEDNIREYYGETYYLATHPSQIKSATDNTGEFSESGDIRFSVGDFGEIYEQFRGKPKEAIAFLMEKQSGEAVGALYHPEIGEIDLVWGEAGTGKSDGYGLAKLVKFHPEVIDNLQEILSEMQIVKQSANRINLESDKYQAAVRLTWNNKAKKWLLTAFEKKNSVLDNTTDTGETSKGSKQNDTATLQDTVSDSKDSDNIENNNILLSVVAAPIDDAIEDGLMLSIEDFAKLAGDIFSVLPESVRNNVMEEAFRNGFDMQSAIFQIPARLAEKRGWDEADKELARAIRDKVQDAVDASGVATERPLTSKEAMWMLYNATRPVAYGDLIGEAEKALAAHNLGFDPKSEALKEKTDAAIRYSAAGGRAIDAATDMYNYEANLWINRLAESWLDMHQSVIALQNALADASGKPIESWEDIVLALNQLSSKSYADKKKYMRDFLKPLWDTIMDMVRYDNVSIEEIERYMMLKHGLERNDVFAKRDAREYYHDFYKKVADRMKTMSHAQLVVAISEAKKTIQEINDEMASASSSKKTSLKERLAKAQNDLDIMEKALRGDEKLNEQELQAKMDAVDAGRDAKYLEFREKDYGGLTGLFFDYDEDAVGKRSKYRTEEAYQSAVRAATKPKFDNVSDMEDAARDEVEEFEDRHSTDLLWQRINAATKETLRHQHASGMITTEQYDAVRDMFEYYVPLRGFADNTAEDMYSYYMSNSAGGFAKPLIAAKGRKTRAESPLGWIGTMAESAIQQDNKNDVKMRLYYALLNRPDNGLLSMSETWYEYSHTDSVTGKKVFVPAFPPATGGVLSADQMRAHMDAWEAGMKAKQAAGQAYKASQKIDLKGSVIFQDIKEEKEHIIQVRVAGKEYSIIVNGNPRAAQAINGLLNPDAKHGPVRDAIGWVRRGMSSLMTSLSPLFWVANYQRDLLSSTMRTSLEYGWKEAWNYFNNRRNAWRVASYINKYEEGTLGDSYYENLYKEFAENGGITGYTVLATNKEYEKMLENYAKHVDQKVLNFIRNIWDKFMGFGEAIEQVSRFAAYITARESGKSIEDSVSAAKEVSVNFNRKGSSSPISWDEAGKLRKKNGNPLNIAEKIFAVILSAMPWAMKGMYFFFNASVQATSSSFQKAKKSPGKAAAWAAFYFGTSLAVALINNMLADDDEEEYLDLPDYLRQSTLLIPVGNGYYAKWSLPQEMRPFYSMADILVSKIKGKTPHKNAWQVGKEMGLTTMQWLPMNPFDAEDPILAFVPDWIAPEWEAYVNKTAFGGKIYDDMIFKPEAVRENIPAYRKATSKTGKVYVEMSELLNAISGGDEVQKGAININPAVVEHLVEGHLAGMYDLAKMVVSLPMSILRGEDVELKDIPFVNKVLMSVDELNVHSRVNEAFYFYQDIATNAERVEKEYRDFGMPEKAASYRMTNDWRIHMLFKQYEPDLKEYKDKLKEVTDEEEKDLLLDGQNVIREQLINDIASGKGPDPVTEIRLGIKSMEEEVKRTTKPYKDADKRVKEARERKDYEAKAKAQKERDSIKRTDEYKSAKIMEKEIKELKKRLDGLGSESSPAQRDSVIGEIERDYEALIGKIMRSSSE